MCFWLPAALFVAFSTVCISGSQSPALNTFVGVISAYGTVIPGVVVVVLGSVVPAGSIANNQLR